MLNGKGVSENFMNFSNIQHYSGQSNHIYPQNYNYDKGKNINDLTNGKAIFSSSNKDKSIKPQNQNFKITKEKEVKTSLNDFSDQFKVQSNKINTINNTNTINKSDLNDFQIPVKTQFLPNAEAKTNGGNSFQNFNNNFIKRDKRFKTIDGTSNIKYLLSNIPTKK
jgi:hypothetical protein